MNHLTIEQKRLPEGGDKHSPAAKVEIAKREGQVVALRLRNYSFSEIGLLVGISKQAANKLFDRALHRITDADIHTHHRIELAKLELEESEIWKILDRPENEQADKIRLMCFGCLKDIHVRRAKLLGLDAPTKMDVTGLYGAGVDEISAERAANERVWLAIPLEEQARIYDMLDAAKKGLTIETTANPVTDGTNRKATPEDASAIDET